MKTKHYIILTFLVMLYHYNVFFWFLFTHIRKYLFLWGVYLVVSQRNVLGFKFSYIFFKRFILCTLVILLLTLFASIRGNELEMMALQIPVSFFINIFAAFPIVYYLYKWNRFKDSKTIFNSTITIILLAIITNNMIAISKLIIPPVHDFLMGLQIQPSEMFESISRVDAYRLGGWGDNLVFSGGTSSALGIILAMYKYCNNSKRINKILYLFAMIFILFSGILIARTTLIGVPIACLLLLYYINDIKTLFKYVFVGIILCASIVGLFFIIAPRLDENMATWAFELVFNFIDDGEVTGESMNVLSEMWKILPNNLSTWLVGDGIFETASGYYKGTDVGLMRIIFFIGIIGLIAIIKLFHLFFFDKYADKETRVLEKVLVLWFLVMNLKGIFLPIHVACLFFWINNINKNDYVQA